MPVYYGRLNIQVRCGPSEHCSKRAMQNNTAYQTPELIPRFQEKKSCLFNLNNTMICAQTLKRILNLQCKFIKCKFLGCINITVLKNQERRENGLRKSGKNGTLSIYIKKLLVTWLDLDSLDWIPSLIFSF